MSDQKTPIFPADWPILLPPRIFLVSGLGPRRRAQRLVIAACTVLASMALAILAAQTGREGLMVLAALTVVAGFIVGFLHDRRVRPAQKAEDEARATSLLRSFDAPLEIRRQAPLEWPVVCTLGFAVFAVIAVYYRFDTASLACAGAYGAAAIAAWFVALSRRGVLLTMSREGVTLEGKSLSWREIEAIEPWTAGSPFTSTLALQLLGGRVPVHLKDASEQPFVIYAVLDGLFQRLRYQHLEGEHRAEAYRSSSRPKFELRFATREPQLTDLLFFLACAAGVFGATFALRSELPWLALFPISVAIIACLLIFDWSAYRQARQAAADDARIEELQAGGRDGRKPFTIQRNRKHAWAAGLSILFMIAAGIGWIIGDPGIAIVVAIIGVPIVLVAWLMSWWNSRGHIAVLHRDRISLPHVEIAWSNVANLEMTREIRTEMYLLVLQVRKPIEPRGFRARMNSVLSHGASDREFVVSLRGAVEEPAVIHQLAQQFWRSGAGDRQVEAAQEARFERDIYDRRKFSEMPAGERWRAYGVLCGIVLWICFAFHGGAAKFLASRAWFIPSVVIATVLTVTAIALLVKYRGLASLRNRPGGIGYFVMFLVVLAMLSGTTWLTLGRSWPDLYTRLAGDVQLSTMSYEKSRPEDRCTTYLDLYARDGRGPVRFCAPDDLYQRLKKTGTLRVQTRDTWFGQHVDGIRVDP